MALIAPQSTSKTFTPAPQGSHFARCFRMTDLGTQPRKDFQTNETYFSRMIRLDFELPDETHVFREENGPEPHSIGDDYTFSMSNKAKLRKFLEQWRGKPFTDEESQKFDVAVLLGKSCMLNVVHVEKNGNVYANIASFMPIPKALKDNQPHAFNRTSEFSIDGLLAGDKSYVKVFLDLPEFIKKKIRLSKEWPKIAPFVGEDGPYQEAGEPEHEDRTDHSVSGDEDDIPFN